jgi:ABC-type ATPase involved in cell division
MAPLLSLRQVTKRHLEGRRSIVVLDRVSLEVENGDFLGIWGPKRSGKSTLLRVMTGIEQPDDGEVYFGSRTLAEMSARERARALRSDGIALVCSDWRTHIVRPVVELVAAACASDGTTMREARTRARKTLARVDANECADVSTDRLTLGERLRVGLAMALVREPRLLLVDEPAVLPSPLESDELQCLLRALGQERDLAVVIASESLEALSGARRTMSVSSGEVRSMDQTGVVVAFPNSVSRTEQHLGDAIS